LPAHAWRDAARRLLDECERDADCDSAEEAEVTRYIIEHVVPSLLRRAAIIQRNRPRRAKP